ncbi:MAG: dihydrofolate reductase [Oscillospiraceae bacterium]|jgi:dihydrofolate reductase|nr:dihydrofolate reductase [Oscillospiraceae bacterium]
MTAIAAVDIHWGIGRNGGLLLPLPPDLRRFRALTLGHAVVMGRRTFQSLPGGHGLPGRRNLVLTRTPDRPLPGAEAISLSALLALRAPEGGEVFVMGGQSVYEQLLPHCRAAHITKIEADLGPADAFFPNLDSASGWRLVSRTEAEHYQGVAFFYAYYERACGT